MSRSSIFFAVYLSFQLGSSGALAADAPAPIEPAADGVFHMPATAAHLEGKSPRLDREAGEISGWSGKKERAVWKVNCPKMGNYDVAVTWCVPAAIANQAYNIDIDFRSTIRAFTVSTGNDNDFKREIVGRIMLAAGQHDVVFHPSGGVRSELCRLKKIEFIPVDDGSAVASFEPVELHVPKGFEVELVAGPPLTRHPMLACFDDQGRLYVAESTGVNADGSVLEQSPPHEIRVLEDTDGDGKFDKQTLFADKLTFPQGIVWHDGSIYASSPPNFWRFTDTDGDLVADNREVLATGFPFRGMSDDMHGASVGRDGRIYFASGRFPQAIRRPDGPVIYEGYNPIIFRCRPDGADLEAYCGAMGNAVGVDFNDAGDCFASGTFGVNAPGKRDVLNHCVEGGAYPVLGQQLVNHKLTGTPLPNLTQFGASASSDIMTYRDGAFGAEYRGNLFSALFNLRKIARHVLEPDGATFRCRNEDFVTSTNADFHPTDVLEDADGSLLVIDTGAWFLIGCPTSVIAKPQISGAIYRIRRSDGRPVGDPRGKAIAWSSLKPDALAALLDDPRYAVRDRAMSTLAAKGESVVAALKGALSESSPPIRRLNAVWTLSRIDSPEAVAAARSALADPDDSVRQAAATVAGLFRDAAAAQELSKILSSDKSPAVRREAATSLGRIGNKQTVPALLASLPGITDRFLDHAIIFALIRIDSREQTVAGLSDRSPDVRRGALIALDQMEHGNLTQDDVTRALETDNSRVQKAALDVISRRKGWSKQIIQLSRDWLADPKLPKDRQSALRGVLMALANDGAIQKLIAQSLNDSNAPQWARLLLLEVIGQSELGKLPPTWSEALLASLQAEDAEIARAAVTAIATVNQSLGQNSQFGRPELLALGRNNKLPSDLRIAAAVAALRGGQPIDGPEFDLLVGQCRPEVEPVTRLAAAGAIGSAKLDSSQRDRVLHLITSAGPLELPALIRTFETADAGPISAKLIQSLERSPGLSSLSGDRIAKLLNKTTPDARSAADALLQRSQVDSAGQRQRLDELSSALTGGDADRGRALFFGNKATCSSCHRIGEEGANIGPNLAGIGEIRTRRDLLEAVVFPSASFARNFEPFNVLLTSGVAHSGIITRTTNDAVFLVNAERATVRIPRSEIEEDGILPGKQSIMPQGLDRILQPDELRDLLAYLSSLKESK